MKFYEVLYNETGMSLFGPLFRLILSFLEWLDSGLSHLEAE